MEMFFDKEVLLPCLYSFVASFAFCVDFNIRKVFIISASFGGLLSQVVYSILEYQNVNEILCYVIASAAITVYSEIMAKTLRVPVNLHLVVAVIPLVPGSMIYKAMIILVNGDINLFLVKSVETFVIAGAIAMGIFFVSSFTIFFKANKALSMQKLQNLKKK